MFTLISLIVCTVAYKKRSMTEAQIFIVLQTGQ